MEAGAVPRLHLGRARDLGAAVKALERTLLLKYGEVAAHGPDGYLKTLGQFFDRGFARLAEDFQQQFLATQAARLGHECSWFDGCGQNGHCNARSALLYSLLYRMMLIDANQQKNLEVGTHDH